MIRRGAIRTSAISLGYKHEKCRGFLVTLQDGFEFEHYAGLSTISRELIDAHGRVVKATEL